jgi:hypothetical protein
VIESLYCTKRIVSSVIVSDNLVINHTNVLSSQTKRLLRVCLAQLRIVKNCYEL